MKLKNLLAFLCVLALSVQVLPVKQLGSFLFSGELQEEVSDFLDVEKEPDKLFKEAVSFVYSTQLSGALLSGSAAYFPFTTALPSSHEGEIHTPPPNTA